MLTTVLEEELHVSPWCYAAELRSICFAGHTFSVEWGSGTTYDSAVRAPEVGGDGAGLHAF